MTFTSQDFSVYQCGYRTTLFSVIFYYRSHTQLSFFASGNFLFNNFVVYSATGFNIGCNDQKKDLLLYLFQLEYSRKYMLIILVFLFKFFKITFQSITNYSSYEILFLVFCSRLIFKQFNIKSNTSFK